jgi:quercetin dioxygenase-like cupin family protein
VSGRPPRGAAPVKASVADVPVDGTLAPEHGWRDLQVRWLVTGATMGAETTVVGRSVFPPGARHDLHRHPGAEEWEYVLEGAGVKHLDGVDVPIVAGDIVFSPRNTYHGVANTSEATLTTLWGYTGAASLEQAGYVLPADDDDPAAPRGPWTPEGTR